MEGVVGIDTEWNKKSCMCMIYTPSCTLLVGQFALLISVLYVSIALLQDASHRHKPFASRHGVVLFICIRLILLIKIVHFPKGK
jgi:hypothetical protein